MARCSVWRHITDGTQIPFDALVRSRRNAASNTHLSRRLVHVQPLGVDRRARPGSGSVPVGSWREGVGGDLVFVASGSLTLCYLALSEKLASIYNKQ